MFARLLLLATLTNVALGDDTNLVDTFVSSLTGTTTDEAKSLVDLLNNCNTDSDDLFQKELKTGINATRACTKQASRENAKKCINDVVSFAHLTWSPYTVFSAHELSTAEIDTLESCEAGVSTDAEIISAFEVLVRRFMQCKVDLTSGTVAYDTVLDVFKGTEQMREFNRAQLTSICSALRFSGQTHKEAVNSLSAMFKNYLFLLPNRRKLDALGA